MVPDIWEERYRVRSYDVEPDGRASLTAVFSYLLESAGIHASAGGFGFEGMMARGLVWVLTRFKLVMERYPAFYAEVRVQTWAKGRDGLFHARDFLLKDDAGSVLGRAASSWAVLSAETRRPEKTGIFLEGFPQRPHDHGLEDRLQKLPLVENPDRESEYRVRFSDLDFNRHANSMRYIEWILNGLDPETRYGRPFRSLEVNYLAEAKPGDEVIIRTKREAGPDAAILAAVLAKSDGRDMARARIELG